MKTLFVIGNGFDCYAHKMPTQYLDFKEYLIKQFPEYDEDFVGILESTLMPDGDEAYDMDAVVGSIVRLINECAGDEWSVLEASVGTTYASSIRDDNDWNFSEVEWWGDDDKNDKEIRHAIYNNEDTSNNITGAYAKLNELFEEWVFQVLGQMDFRIVKKIKKLRLRKVFS